MVFSHTYNHWFSNRRQHISFHNSLFWRLLVIVPLQWSTGKTYFNDVCHGIKVVVQSNNLGNLWTEFEAQRCRMYLCTTYISTMLLHTVYCSFHFISRVPYSLFTPATRLHNLCLCEVITNFVNGHCLLFTTHHIEWIKNPIQTHNIKLKTFCCNWTHSAKMPLEEWSQINRTILDIKRLENQTNNMQHRKQHCIYGNKLITI